MLVLQRSAVQILSPSNHKITPPTIWCTPCANHALLQNGAFLVSESGIEHAPVMFAGTSGAVGAPKWCSACCAHDGRLFGACQNVAEMMHIRRTTERRHFGACLQQGSGAKHVPNMPWHQVNHIAYYRVQACSIDH